MIGSRLGAYEITAKLGEGGMGEVWRAHDPKLRRDVAIKVLPAAFTQDKERLARFEREAQLLAQLNHTSIAQIYGMETTGEAHALVMELVEGPTLADRLAQGALPLDESLSKPQNVKASREGKTKVLDFGLAKAMDPAGAGAASSGFDAARSPTLMNSPTLTAAHGTQLGVILGTAAYMSPEQAKGKAVDRRGDIWAFGVVLFEMVTGRRLFEGETASETLAAVIRQQIDWSLLPAGTPPALRGLLERCLERDPKLRLRDIGEARLALDRLMRGETATAAPVPPVPGASRRREALAWSIAALLALATAGVWFMRSSGSDAPAPPRVMSRSSSTASAPACLRCRTTAGAWLSGPAKGPVRCASGSRSSRPARRAPCPGPKKATAPSGPRTIGGSGTSPGAISRRPPARGVPSAGSPGRATRAAAAGARTARSSSPPTRSARCSPSPSAAARPARRPP